MNKQLSLLYLLLLQGISTHAMESNITRRASIQEEVFSIGEIAQEIVLYIDPSLNNKDDIDLKNRKNATYFSMVNTTSYKTLSRICAKIPISILFKSIFEKTLQRYDIATQLPCTIQDKTCCISTSNDETLELIPYIHRGRNSNDALEMAFFIECIATFYKGSLMDTDAAPIIQLWTPKQSIVDQARKIFISPCKQKTNKDKVDIFVRTFLEKYFFDEVNGLKYIAMLQTLLNQDDCIKNIELQVRKFPCENQNLQKYTFTVNFSFTDHTIDSQILHLFFDYKAMQPRN